MTELNYTNDGSEDLFVRNKTTDSTTVAVRIDPVQSSPRTITVSLGPGERQTFQSLDGLAGVKVTVSVSDCVDQQFDSTQHGGTVAVFVGENVRIRPMTV